MGNRNTGKRGTWVPALICFLLCAALCACALADSGIERDADGGTWDYDRGIYTDPSGKTYESTPDAIEVVVINGIGTCVTYLCSSIYGIDGRGTDVTIEHTVDHHRSQMMVLIIAHRSIAGKGIIAHNTGS